MINEIKIISDQATQLLSEKKAIREEIEKNKVARCVISTEKLICTISIMELPEDKNQEIKLFEEIDKLAGVIKE